MAAKKPGVVIIGAGMAAARKPSTTTATGDPHGITIFEAGDRIGGWTRL